MPHSIGLREYRVCPTGIGFLGDTKGIMNGCAVMGI
jgi:hypothetical protein